MNSLVKVSICGRNNLRVNIIRAVEGMKHGVGCHTGGTDGRFELGRFLYAR